MVSVVNGRTARRSHDHFDSGIDTEKFVSRWPRQLQGGQVGRTHGQDPGWQGKIFMVAVQPGAESTMQRNWDSRRDQEVPRYEIVDKRFAWDFAKSLAVTETCSRRT